MSAPRRRITAGEAGQMAGKLMGAAIQAERKRNRWLFLVTWAGVVLSAVLGVVF